MTMTLKEKQQNTITEYKNLHDRALGAAMRLLCEKDGHEPLEQQWSCDEENIDIITKDKEGVIHFITVTVRRKEFPPVPTIDDAFRDTAERLAMAYLTSYSGPEAAITWDLFMMAVLDNDRCMVRMLKNALCCV